LLLALISIDQESISHIPYATLLDQLDSLKLELACKFCLFMIHLRFHHDT